MAGSETEVIIFTVMYAIAMLVALVGNILLIHIVRKKSEVRSLTSVMFVNMAVADLLVSLVMMPWSIVHRYTHGKWLIKGTLGEITCRSIIFIAYVTVMASVLCLAIMAIDRFYAIVCVMNRRNRWFRKAKFVTPLVWVTSVTLMSIMPIIYHVNDESSMCEYTFLVLGNETRAIRGVFLYIFLTTYLLPVVVIAILYTKVAHKIWFHQAPGNQLNENQQQRQLTKRRVVRMLIIIVLVFAFCWLPAQAYHLAIAITAWKVNMPPLAMYIFYWLGHANSAINPWLYIGLSSKIRSAFTRMLSNMSIRGSRSTQRAQSKKATANKEKVESQV